MFKEIKGKNSIEEEKQLGKCNKIEITQRQRKEARQDKTDRQINRKCEICIKNKRNKKMHRMKFIERIKKTNLL